jgi:outer membrane protein assembly factor BamB
MTWRRAVLAAATFTSCAAPTANQASRVLPVWESPGAGAPGGIESRSLAGRTVVAFGTAGELLGVDAPTGTVSWRVPLSVNPPRGGPVRVSDGVVALVTGEGGISVAAESGRILARSPNYGRTQNGDNISGSQPLMLSTGRIAFTDTVHTVMLYEPATGDVDTLVQLPQVPAREIRRPRVASFVQVGDTLFVIRLMDDEREPAYRVYTVYRVLLRTGALDSLPSQSTRRMQPSTWLEARDGNLFFASEEYESGWALVDRASGQVRRWLPATLGYTGHQFQKRVIGDTLFAVVQDGGIYAINIRTGELLRRGSFLQQAGSGGKGIAVCKDRIYASVTAGGIVVHDRATMRYLGRVRSRSDLEEDPPSVTYFVQTPTLAILQTEQSMMALDCPAP